MKSNRTANLVYIFSVCITALIFIFIYQRSLANLNQTYNLNKFITIRFSLLLLGGIILGSRKLLISIKSKGHLHIQLEFVIFFLFLLLISLTTVLKVEILLNIFNETNLNITLISIVSQFMTGYVFALIFERN
jgi:hypothetical protein